MKWVYRCFLVVLACVLVAEANAAEQDTTEQDTKAQAGHETRLLSEVRQLIFEGRRSGEGYFGADGKQMVFQSEREPGNPFYQIYLMDLASGDTARISPGIGKTTCAWIHPTGDKVMFASTHEDPRAKTKQQDELKKRAEGQGSRYSWSFDEYYDIYEADTEGRRLRNLTRSPGYDAEGSWSPDGRSIVFASNRHAYSGKRSDDEKARLAEDKSYFMDIYIMEADGGKPRRLTSTPGYDGGPFFSADGRHITWRRFTPDGKKAEIWTMHRDGSDKRQITQLDALSWAPYFHPSGDYIIFSTNLHGYNNFELYIVAADGRSPPVRVTATDGFDGLPVFSPDGHKLAWTSKRTANRQPQIFLANWNHAAARKLLALSENAETAGSPISKPKHAAPTFERTRPAITQEDLRLHLEYLAAEEMGGRLTGTEGEQRATDYLASIFAALGLQPAGDMGGWFQTFEFTRGVSMEPDNRLELTQAGETRPLELDREWRPLSFSRTGEIETAGIVFAGYGIVAPEGTGFPAYDAYRGLDIRDKWVLAFRYLPEDISPEQRQHLSEFSGLRYKAMLARDKGALGLILVSGPKAQVREQLVKLKADSVDARTSVAVLSITDEVAKQLLVPSGKDLGVLQTSLDTGQQQSGFALSQVQLGADIRLKQERHTGRNVLARLIAGDRPSESLVVLGAHVDHIGNGIGLNSRASGDHVGRVHPGADDNASGVAALLEIAQYLQDWQTRGGLNLKRDILFAAWSGEELGRLGSSYFVDVYGDKGAETNGLTPKVTAYLNMDMVGRLDRHLFLQGAGSSSIWRAEIERRNAPIGLPIQIRQDSYLPTDAISFYLRGVPILSAFTGTHTDYNTPRDTADRINYPSTAKIAKLMALITRSLARLEQTPDYIETKKPENKASRANLRAYLGTIPEYGESDVQGVTLSGVAKGGPADKAGLRGGDVIVEIAGRKIENIYDFTYALNALKVGQAVKIVVARGNRRENMTVTPASRE